MDKDSMFKAVQADIAAGRLDLVGPRVMNVAEENSGDVFTLLTCASLLKVAGDGNGVEKTVKLIMSALPEDEMTRFDVAQGLHSLGYASRTADILENLEPIDDVLRFLARALFETGRSAEALKKMEAVSASTIDDDVFKVEVLDSVGDTDGALKVAEELMTESPELFEVRRAYCSALVVSGRLKDAQNFVRSKLKENKTSADNNALAAHVMWAMGKSRLSGAYSRKALEKDPKHIPAMEIFGLSLAEIGEYDRARIVAGAINEISPGNPSAVKILDFCKR